MRNRAKSIQNLCLSPGGFVEASYIVSMIRCREFFYFSFPNKEYV